MPHDLLAFAAIFFCGLALIPAAAHAMELPNKIRLSKDEYRIAQKLYRGWQAVAPIVLLALAATAALAVQSSSATMAARVAAVMALVCIALTQVIFWAFTFPANRATHNWTTLPPDWADLRRRWEYSHAASAGFNLLAFVAAVLAVLWS